MFLYTLIFFLFDLGLKCAHLFDYRRVRSWEKRVREREGLEDQRAGRCAMRSQQWNPGA